MAKAILVCGKICSGKTTYAKSLVKEHRAILLSCDEIMLALFGQYCGDLYDEMQERTMGYLFSKSLEVIEVGTTVILDFGFWSRAKREEAKAFFMRNEVDCELHYIDISDETWHRNVSKRNKDVENATAHDCYIDDNLAEKCLSLFEAPTPEEIDVWHKNDWM